MRKTRLSKGFTGELFAHLHGILKVFLQKTPTLGRAKEKSYVESIRENYSWDSLNFFPMRYP